MPLSATTIGTAWALHGLWAAQWLTDVEGLNRAAMVWHLFVMAVAVSLGALLWGIPTDRLRRRGIGPQALLGFAATVAIAAQLGAHLAMASAVIPSVGDHRGGRRSNRSWLRDPCEQFPKELAGRANALLNFFHISAAFAVQIGTGLVPRALVAGRRALSPNSLSDRVRSQRGPPDLAGSGSDFPGFPHLEADFARLFECRTDLQNTTGVAEIDLWLCVAFVKREISMNVIALSQHQFGLNLDLLAAMFRSSPTRIQGSSGLDRVVTGDLELDVYDALNRTYLLLVSAEREVVGCVRLLPTTGPTMLADTFPQSADGAQSAPK